MGVQFKPMSTTKPPYIYRDRYMKIISQFYLFVLIFSALSINISYAEIKVVDDLDNILMLESPAKRVVALSPGITELVFAAGGGNLLKGAVSYSDFPPEAKSLPIVGSYNSVDVESILSLNPDLVIAWQSGNPPLQIAKLKNLGLNVYISEPRNFENIPKTLIRFGKLMGTQVVAEAASDTFLRTLNNLKLKYSNKKQKEKTVFIQIWNQPVMSINGEHLISKIVEFCGGSNIFHDAKQLTLSLDVETVLQRNPNVIIATRDGEIGERWLSRWRQWEHLSAIEKNQLFAVHPDHVVRHTPRVLLGIEQICKII